MILRAVAFLGGLGGAVALSQYPEFAQQYTQRLAGQVEALSVVVEDFDSSAAESDLTRSEALAQMAGTEFLEDRRTDMVRTFARHQSLSSHYAALTQATPMQRLLMPHRLGDREVFSGTWSEFVPAMPLSAAGGVAAAVGFLGGWLIIGLVAALLVWPLRRLRHRNRRAANGDAGQRTEPPVSGSPNP